MRGIPSGVTPPVVRWLLAGLLAAMLLYGPAPRPLAVPPPLAPLAARSTTRTALRPRSGQPAPTQAAVEGAVDVQQSALLPGAPLQASIPGNPADPVSWWLSGSQGVYPLLASQSTVFDGNLPLVLPGGEYTLFSCDNASPAQHCFSSPVFVALGGLWHSGTDPFSVYQRQGLLPLFSRGTLGQGQTIALYGQSQLSLQDVSLFDALYGLPAPALTIVTPQGSAGIPAAGSGAAGLEVAADVEWAHALAPDAKILLYLYPPATDGVLQSADLAVQAGATALSISYGAPISGSTASWNASLQQDASQGLAIFAASGDAGQETPAYWPTASPAVVSVGGLSYTSSGTTYWDGASGKGGYGVSLSEATPAWQGQAGVTAGRTFPDVSMLASHVPVVVGGQLVTASGTSFAAPQWAAVWALLQQSYAASHHGAQLTAAPGPTLYAVALHQSATAAAFPAAVGPGPHFSAQTGWGAPDVQRLIQAVDALAQPAPSGLPSVSGGQP